MSRIHKGIRIVQLAPTLNRWPSYPQIRSEDPTKNNSQCDADFFGQSHLTVPDTVRLSCNAGPLGSWREEMRSSL
jgi:hypothetical protein